MYPPIKEKHRPHSPTRTRYGTLRRVIPRHTKAYLWLGFLVVVFGYLLLIDNGVSIYDLLPRTRYIPSIANEGTTFTSESTLGISPSATKTENVYPSPTKDEPELEQGPKSLVFGEGANAFTPEDVVILFKTGATTLWRRVPIHLSTTLSNSSITPNVVFYSDQADQIAGRPIVDVLANVSSTLKSSRDFELYRTLKTIPSKNLYLEAATIDGDQWLPGGWRLDKYKFLPMMSHAAANYPDKKWYIYMEDDNYYFWHSLYTWLSTFNSAEPLFLGGPAARLGEDFAHGGSGFVLSGAAMRKTFGANPDLANEWESYAAERCCGDQVLSHVMAVNGVARDRRFDHTGWAGLQALQHTRMAFGHWNWCSPLFNVHKVHQGDVSNLFVLEREFQAKFGENKVMTWGGLFELTLTSKVVDDRKLEWDNDATEKWYRSSEADQALTDAERQTQPWFSADACEASCRDWHLCLSWKYADDACGLSSTVVAGKPVDEGISLTSGYLLDKIEVLREKACEPLGYGA